MQECPTFTVIVPTYNQAAYLGLALDSLLAQTNPDWEAVVVNDGSTDSTVEVMTAYAEREPRIRIFHKKNGGTGSALNEGLRQARGEWICWLSSDDLFDKRKLEIHQAYIQREPETSFFYTHFFVLHDEDNRIESPPLWRAIPAREWEVLEILRTTFIHGISVCIRHEAMKVTGNFDEQLRYGQDYDMLLRLLVAYPATFIPERTCIQRLHPGQTNNTFSEAGFFDYGRAAIEFLNQNKFERLVPSIDLSDSEQASHAVDKALDVATTFDSWFLYGLGPHPALLWRIIEWVLCPEESHATNLIREAVQNRILNVLQKRNLDPAIRFQWKLAYTAIKLKNGNFRYPTLSVDELVKQRLWQLSASNEGNYDALYRYLVNWVYELEPVPVSIDTILQGGEVVLVCQPGASVDGLVKYGAARAWIELAHYLMRTGKQVLLIGISDNRLGFTENVLYLGVQTDAELFEALRLLSPLDSLIGISRVDVFLGPTVDRPLIYQHGPHLPVGEYATSLIRRFNIPVVVVSRDSMNYQLQHGVPGEQVHFIYNGYDSRVFRLKEDVLHAPHRIIFAGMGIFYKGLDIAVRAFLDLKKDFPDAEFYIFGSRHDWRNESAHLWPAGWLDQQGFPDLSRVEAQGIGYFGEAGQEELAEAMQKCSLLVMPSRVHETFGLVSVEAQACGCIPVLPRQGGFPETMREGLTGYLYDSNTPEELADAIRDLWNRNLPTEEQRRQSAMWVQQEFSWEKTGEQIAEILNSLPVGKRHALFIEKLFWDVAVRTKVKLKNTYHQVKSPVLRKTLKLPYSIVRRLYHRFVTRLC